MQRKNGIHTKLSNKTKPTKKVGKKLALAACAAYSILGGYGDGLSPSA